MSPALFMSGISFPAEVQAGWVRMLVVVHKSFNPGGSRPDQDEGQSGSGSPRRPRV